MQWMSPVQRAAALKKQQQYMREMEEANRPEWERKKVVMSLGIKGGRVVKTFERSSGTSSGKSTVSGAAADDEEAGDDDGEDSCVGMGGDDAGDGQTQSTTRAKLSENPLLRDGKLVRPVWKAPTPDDATTNNATEKDEFKGKGILKGMPATRQSQGASERKAMWRRVQDDDEGDNERWILDGGLHGFGEERGEDYGGR